MEKVRPLCSQPSNRGRLKNITEHYYYIFALHNHHAKNNNTILTASRTQKCVMDTTTFFLFSLSLSACMCISCSSSGGSWRLGYYQHPGLG